MKTTVYVDVLLAINYIVNLLLILCTAKCVGLTPKRRRIVAAALLGSLCSLTIFLPFMGFFAELASKLLISAAIVRIAFPYHSHIAYLRHWFAFFAVNFFFAGIILAIWMAFAPRWLTYYNGIVYFNVSSFSLVFATVIAYLVLLLANRLGRSGRLQGSLCKVQVYLGGKVSVVTGLIDSGNRLTEPFSGAPVIVCRLEDMRLLLPQQMIEAIQQGKVEAEMYTQWEQWGVPLRLIPFSAVGGGGVLAAFAPDKLVISDQQGMWHVDSVYVALSAREIGDSNYRAIISPECIRMKIKNGGAN